MSCRGVAVQVEFEVAQILETVQVAFEVANLGNQEIIFQVQGLMNPGGFQAMGRTGFNLYSPPPGAALKLQRRVGVLALGGELQIQNPDIVRARQHKLGRIDPSPFRVEVHHHVVVPRHSHLHRLPVSPLDRLLLRLGRVLDQADGGQHRHVVAVRLHGVVLGVAAQVAFKRKGLKPVFHFIGSRVDARRLSGAMGQLHSTWYCPTTDLGHGCALRIFSAWSFTLLSGCFSRNDRLACSSGALT
jgi:hypothetical protein